ncbi:Kiwa anti-phage protein KwaB-like domain-containing protein [Gemmiger formicilis]|uniref:Kiwa anti-phage protein KwaB-like domain-containing protein n=1 Tax=Gemmiger formicilis TaxID=745368 RepID=UPI0035219858
MNQNLQVTAENVIEMLRSVQEKSPDNALRVFFSEKRTTEKYRTFMPQASNELQKKMLSLVLTPLIKALELPVVEYNPVGVLDEENELIVPTQVACVGAFKESLAPENLVTEMNLIKISKISFYCLEVTYQEKKVYIFRQFTKMKRIRKGILSQLVNDELRELNSDFLGIDELTDMVLMDDTLLILNHISLERIFNYRDKFQEMTNQAIGRIVVEGRMANVEQFSEDCLNDVRIMKRFTDIMSKDRLPLFFDNYDRVPDIVKALELDIEFDNEGKMIYRDKSQLFHIIHLMSDAYFQSLLSARYGVAEMEGTI